MPINLSELLVIGVSSRALFDLEEANRVFESEGVDAYARYQLEHENDVLEPGTGFPLIQAILKLNERMPGPRQTEVVIVSQNSPATSLRLFNSITHYGLDIQRAVLSGGAPTSPYLHAFDVDLFLSASPTDVDTALAARVAAGLIYPTPCSAADPREQIRIAFDGDAVLFSDQAERVFQNQGLDAFIAHETLHAHLPLPEGPLAKLLRTFSVLQARFPAHAAPIRLALVTARSMPAHERVIRTLHAWNVRIDEAFFMGGVSKTPILEAFQPHIYFDDQQAHCDPASRVVPTARVPYRELASPAPGPSAQPVNGPPAAPTTAAQTPRRARSKTNGTRR
jgi:5'-nucleotidase